MTTILRDITTELQTQCHNGESHSKIKVKILDTYYDISGIKKVVSGDETYFVIETEV